MSKLHLSQYNPQESLWEPAAYTGEPHPSPARTVTIHNTKRADRARLAPIHFTGIHNIPSKTSRNAQFWNFALDTSNADRRREERKRGIHNPPTTRTAFGSTLHTSTPVRPHPEMQQGHRVGLDSLTQTEHEVLGSFRAAVEEKADEWAGRVTDTILIRCLVARKFDVERALVLLESYCTVLKPAINPAQLTFKDIAPMFQTGALTLPGGRDIDGAKLIVFHGDIYEATTALQPMHLVKLALYLVHNAMKHELTLRQGFTIIMVGMSGSAREEALRNIFVETFQNRYPARIRSVVIIADSWLESILLKMAKPFIKSKLRSKIEICGDTADLEAHVANEQLTEDLDGTHQYDHTADFERRAADVGLDPDEVDISQAAKITLSEEMLMYTNEEIKQARLEVANCEAYGSLNGSPKTAKAKKRAMAAQEAVVANETDTDSTTPSAEPKSNEAHEEDVDDVEVDVSNFTLGTSAYGAGSEMSGSVYHANELFDSTVKFSELYPPVRQEVASVEKAAPNMLKSINRIRRARGLAPLCDSDTGTTDVYTKKSFAFGTLVKKGTKKSKRELTPERLEDGSLMAPSPLSSASRALKETQPLPGRVTMAGEFVASPEIYPGHNDHLSSATDFFKEASNGRQMNSVVRNLEQSLVE